MGRRGGAGAGRYPKPARIYPTAPGASKHSPVHAPGAGTPAYGAVAAAGAAAPRGRLNTEARAGQPGPLRPTGAPPRRAMTLSCLRGQTTLTRMSGRPSMCASMMSPRTTGPTFSGVPE